MIEALISFDPALSKYTYEGVPDIRVIIYHGYPVMAMMRCSTHASDGKANLHQGAVGVGIDIAYGHSLYAVQNDRIIEKHPDTDCHFHDIKLANWDKVLQLASSCYEMTKLGYFGADIVLDNINTTKVFKEYNIDYSIEGNKNFLSVCEHKNIDSKKLVNKFS